MSEPIIKHKHQLPWEKYPPGSCRNQRFPDGFDEMAYKAKIPVSWFDWSVYWGIVGLPEYDINHIINLWWDYVYWEPFPREGGRLCELYSVIRERIVDVSYKMCRQIPEDKDYENPCFLRDNNGNWTSMKDTQIHKQHIPWEESMGKLQLKKPPAKSSEKKGKPDKGEASEKNTKKAKARIRVAELLLERKHTDEEICEIIKDELDYNFAKGRVKTNREKLNNGDRANIGFEAPNPPVEEIGGKEPDEGKGKKGKIKNPPPPVPKKPEPPAKKKLKLKK